uniref:SH3 and PX domain-containing protein 2A-like n=1 Tax=Phallusia mammillata TaxID=59560 RepID=A0A6F9DSR8_9ASCI|nr:SH3 and PX domain-containing protein 2A-like [Phallusia mammillata]
MASSLCRSRSLTNVFVQHVTVLDIVQVKTGNNRYSEWVYVIGVTWSDTREHKIFRSYSEVSSLYSFLHKLLSAEKHRNRFLKDLPKVPARGLFDWSTVKLMVRHQATIDSFFRGLICLPVQISRHKVVLDFYEMRDVDNQNYVTKHTIISNNNSRDSSSESTDSQSTNNETDSINADVTTPPTNQRTRAPPSFLPVTSCFEEDDDFYATDYDAMLEDVSALELYEDYLKNDAYFSLQGDATGRDDVTGRYDVSGRYDDERWLRECEEIISPYSPNKAYFRLVHVLENQS